MRRRARVDSNHADVTQALRSVGWWVRDMSRVGQGFPDLLAARGGRLVLVEVKDGDKPLSAQALTPNEAKVQWALLQAGVVVHIVRSIEDAVSL